MEPGETDVVYPAGVPGVRLYPGHHCLVLLRTTLHSPNASLPVPDGRTVVQMLQANGKPSTAGLQVTTCCSLVVVQHRAVGVGVTG